MRAHGRERRLQPLDGLARPDPAEVARARHRQQIEADIGRRCAMRHHRRRVFLEIVRRQHVVGRRDEGFEEAPGPPRDQAQALRVVRGQRTSALTRGDRLTQRATAGEASHSAANSGGQRPRLPAPQTRPSRQASSGDDQGAPTSGDRNRRRSRRGPIAACAAGTHSSRLRRVTEQPIQGAHDGVAHQPGLVRQEDDDQRPTG